MPAQCAYVDPVTGQRCRNWVSEGSKFCTAHNLIRRLQNPHAHLNKAERRVVDIEQMAEERRLREKLENRPPQRQRFFPSPGAVAPAVSQKVRRQPVVQKKQPRGQAHEIPQLTFNPPRPEPPRRYPLQQPLFHPVANVPQPQPQPQNPVNVPQQVQQQPPPTSGSSCALTSRTLRSEPCKIDDLSFRKALQHFKLPSAGLPQDSACDALWRTLSTRAKGCLLPWRITRILGQGVFGLVLALQRRGAIDQPWEFAAAKLCIEEYPGSIRSEIRLQKKVSAEGLAPCIISHCELHPRLHFIVMQRIGDTMHNVLEQNSNKIQDPAIYRTILGGLINILTRLRKLGVTHGDTHLGNTVYVNPSDLGNPSLIDFGRSSDRVYMPIVDAFALFRGMRFLNYRKIIADFGEEAANQMWIFRWKIYDKIVGPVAQEGVCSDNVARPYMRNICQAILNGMNQLYNSHAHRKGYDGGHESIKFEQLVESLNDSLLQLYWKTDDRLRNRR